ncbi:MAG TPA: hypothetical protein VNI01_03575 [Elusimicrobiota bacterium]|nr:hypothetical protein [Elusimicrobiota bacterium]
MKGLLLLALFAAAVPFARADEDCPNGMCPLNRRRVTTAPTRTMDEARSWRPGAPAPTGSPTVGESSEVSLAAEEDGAPHARASSRPCRSCPLQARASSGGPPSPGGAMQASGGGGGGGKSCGKGGCARGPIARFCGAVRSLFSGLCRRCG